MILNIINVQVENTEPSAVTNNMLLRNSIANETLDHVLRKIHKRMWLCKISNYCLYGETTSIPYFSSRFTNIRYNLSQNNTGYFCGDGCINSTCRYESQIITIILCYILLVFGVNYSLSTNVVVFLMHFYWVLLFTVYSIAQIWQFSKVQLEDWSYR